MSLLPIKRTSTFEFAITDELPLPSLLGPNQMMTPTVLVIEFIDGTFTEAKIWGYQLNAKGKQLKSPTYLHFWPSDLALNPQVNHRMPEYALNLIKTIQLVVNP